MNIDIEPITTEADSYVPTKRLLPKCPGYMNRNEPISRRSYRKDDIDRPWFLKVPHTMMLFGKKVNTVKQRGRDHWMRSELDGLLEFTQPGIQEELLVMTPNPQKATIIRWSKAAWKIQQWYRKCIAMRFILMQRRLSEDEKITCPICLEAFCAFEDTPWQQVFTLKSASDTITHYLHTKCISESCLRSGTFENPFTREPLTNKDVWRLDYLNASLDDARFVSLFERFHNLSVYESMRWGDGVADIRVGQLQEYLNTVVHQWSLDMNATVAVDLVTFWFFNEPFSQMRYDIIGLAMFDKVSAIRELDRFNTQMDNSLRASKFTTLLMRALYVEVEQNAPEFSLVRQPQIYTDETQRRNEIHKQQRAFLFRRKHMPRCYNDFIYKTDYEPRDSARVSTMDFTLPTDQVHSNGDGEFFCDCCNIILYQSGSNFMNMHDSDSDSEFELNEPSDDDEDFDENEEDGDEEEDEDDDDVEVEVEVEVEVS